MTDHLKRYLASAEIEYTERVFSSGESIRGLGAEPFVRKNLLYLFVYTMRFY